MPKKKDDTVETPEVMGQIAAGGEDAANNAGTSPEEGTEGKPETSQESASVEQASSVETQETTLEDSNRNDTAQALESLSPSVSPSGDGCREVAELESMNVLADRHRVPTWQQAAVNRLMGWEAGKMVSNADYVSALDKLKARPVGGGRMG